QYVLVLGMLEQKRASRGRLVMAAAGPMVLDVTEDNFGALKQPPISLGRHASTNDDIRATAEPGQPLPPRQPLALHRGVQMADEQDVYVTGLAIRRRCQVDELLFNAVEVGAPGVGDPLTPEGFDAVSVREDQVALLGAAADVVPRQLPIGSQADDR